MPSTSRKGRPAVLLAATALFAGAIGTAGVFDLTGAFGKTVHQTTTVTAAPTQPVSNTAGTALDAKTLYASAAPSTVDITVTSTSGTSGPFGGQPQSSQDSGSGFLVDPNGNIVTAAHVVENASSIKVEFRDGTVRSAKVAGIDNATDVAVIKVDPSGLSLHPLQFGSSRNLSIGDSVAAIGDPFGYDRSISTGIISGLDRTVSAPNNYTVSHALQTDAALNPGNSGGPLLDSSGHVVGIVDQIATGGSSSQNSGVGFAIPTDLVASELNALEAGQKVQHPSLGVSTSDPTGATQGAVVAQVVPGGAASAAGLRVNDIVTAIDGTKVTGSSELVGAIATHKPGDKVTLTIKRGSQTLKVTVTLGTQPNNQVAAN
jgi:putative serine protease PepD